MAVNHMQDNLPVFIVSLLTSVVQSHSDFDVGDFIAVGGLRWKLYRKVYATSHSIGCWRTSDTK